MGRSTCLEGIHPKLWLISQDENSDYDTFDSAVVAAPDEETARRITPDSHKWGDPFSSWASKPENVTVRLIGEAAADIKEGIVLSSFNAG